MELTFTPSGAVNFLREFAAAAGVVPAGHALTLPPALGRGGLPRNRPGSAGMTGLENGFSQEFRLEMQRPNPIFDVAKTHPTSRVLRHFYG